MAVATEDITYRQAPPGKLSWGAIFGGTFVALGIWILLYSFGLAIGLSAMDPENPGSARGAGIWIGIWSVIAPILALFVGGVVASRTAGIVNRLAGAIHGAVIWALALILGMVLLGTTVASALGGVLSLGGQVVSAVGQAVPSGGGQAGVAGVDTQDLLAPVNERLQAQGKPPVTAEGLNAAVNSAIQQSVRQGRLNRDILIQSLAQNTQLSRQDAEQLATQLEGQISQGVGQVQAGALQVADVTGRVMWGVFIALILGLAAAVLGATLGVSRRQARLAAGPPIETRPTPTTPAGPPREVYP